jgi:hypothetical protein
MSKRAVEMPGHGRGGKPKAGFPPRPQPLEIAARFPHSHSRDERGSCFRISNQKGGLAADRFAPAFRLILRLENASSSRPAGGPVATIIDGLIVWRRE